MFFFSYCWFGLCVYWTPCRFELRKGEVIWYSNIEKQQFCKKKKKKKGKKNLTLSPLLSLWSCLT